MDDLSVYPAGLPVWRAGNFDADQCDCLPTIQGGTDGGKWSRTTHRVSPVFRLRRGIGRGNRTQVYRPASDAAAFYRPVSRRNLPDLRQNQPYGPLLPSISGTDSSGGTSGSPGNGSGRADVPRTLAQILRGRCSWRTGESPLPDGAYAKTILEPHDWVFPNSGRRTRTRYRSADARPLSFHPSRITYGVLPPINVYYHQKGEIHVKINIHDEHWKGNVQKTNLYWHWFAWKADWNRFRTGIFKIERGVPSSLSGVFIHTGRRDPEHRIQLPSGRPEKGTESVQRPAQEEILNGYRFPPWSRVAFAPPAE